MRAGSAQGIRYRKFGGEWRVFETAKPISAKSTSSVYAPRLSFKQDVSAVLLLNQA